MSAVEDVSWTTVVAVAVVALACACAVQARWRKSRVSRPLPPGPKGLPILGHLHMIGKSPHRDLQQLAKQYGPVMYLKFGFVDNIVVSSPQAAEQFLKTHDHVFASRPPLEYAKITLYEQRDLIFAEYGDYWRKMRKFCTLELLSNHKLNSFKSMRREEVGLLIESVGRAARDGVGVDLSDIVASMNAEMTCEMVFGKKYSDKDFDERGFKAVIREGMELTTTPNLADYFPYIGALDLQGLRPRLKAVGKVFDEFLERVIDDHVDVQIEGRRQRQNRDFVDIMLGFMESEEAEFRLDRPQIKAIMLDMLVAGMDTSSAAIEWALSELLKHPEVMKKVQKELEEVVGMDRVAEESDLERLEYLDMVVKETMRLHPVAPLLLPHQAMEDSVINGFHIPKKSRVLINVWAIGRDPKVWSDAEKFMPERFVGSDVDVRGQHFQLLPFGSGRRSCPGMQLGLTVVRLVVAQLMHCFDWKLPNGMLPMELDMAENFGVVACRAKHLFAVPTPRLHS